MRVLLCLLSNQHIPNLMSVHHYRPDRLLLLETDRAAREKWADHFLRALQLGGLNYPRETIHVKAEDTIPSVRKALQEAYDKEPSGEWIANATGGTKPMSIATFQFFSALGARVVYLNVPRPDVLLDLQTGQTETCSYRPTIAEYLAGYGFDLTKSPENVAKEEQRAREWCAMAEALAREARSDALLTFPSEKERSRARDKGCPVSTVSWNDWVRVSPTLSAKMAEFAGATDKYTRYQIDFLLGRWLEVFVWNLLTRHADTLGIWDVRLGLEVGREETANDLDVTFMCRRGLVVVECKTGSQTYGPWADVFYKLEAVKQQLAALNIESVLAATVGNILDSDGLSIKPDVQNRARLYRCRIVSLPDIRKLTEESAPTELIRSRFGL
jgi:hypothetical protein